MAKKVKKTKKAIITRKNTKPPTKKWLFIAIIVAFGLIGVKLTFFSNALSFQVVGTHPQASIETTEYAKALTSLAAWNGKVYAGYGDWNTNTGPMSVTPFDPVTGSFASAPEYTADTEAVESPRVIGNKLYLPSTDPRWRADYTVGEVLPDGKVTWTSRADMGMIHVFDMASTDNGQTLFAAGSKTVNGIDHAVVFISKDAGATWNLSLDAPNPDGTGHARMMFMSSYNGKIYAQQINFGNDLWVKGVAPHAWVFSGTNWSKAQAINVIVPTNGAEFAGNILVRRGESLFAYNGNTTTSLGAKGIYTVGNDGYLYALEKTSYGESYVSRTKDLRTWTRVVAAPLEASSIAQLGNTIYLGTYNSKLYKANLDDPGTDAVAPQVAMKSPVNGFTLTTLQNNLYATASDDGGIRKVDFYIDSTFIGTSVYGYAGQYAVTWDGYGVLPGSHSLTAVAYDIYGNSSTSAPVTINVPAGLTPVDTEYPVAGISSPSSFTNLRKSMYVSAYASDNDRVARMEIYLDGQLKQTSSTGSITASIKLVRGAHTLTITAQDRAGNKTSKDFPFTSR